MCCTSMILTVLFLYLCEVLLFVEFHQSKTEQKRYCALKNVAKEDWNSCVFL